MSEVSNMQKLFNLVWERAKDKRAARSRHQPAGYPAACFYRHPEDSTLRCFVGALIKDEHYRSAFEGRGVGYDSVRAAVSASVGFKLDDGDADMLGACQGLHDNNEPGYWETGLRHITETYKLEVPPCAE